MIELSEKLDQSKAELRQFVSERDTTALVNLEIRKYYANFEADAFAWLTSTSVEVQDLILDIIDTLCALRCADAFRERGSTFKTSAGYEVVVNQYNAHAVYALRSRDRKHLFLLKGKSPIRFPSLLRRST